MMKNKLITLLIGFQLAMSIQGNAQIDQVAVSIKPYPLGITSSKTTHLIFPYAILHIDRGSKDILAQKVVNAENVLELKASKAHFEQTNLTVITTDGKLFSYLLNYTDNPSELSLQIGNLSIDHPVLFSKVNQADIKKIASGVALKPSFIRHINDNKFGMQCRLGGLYIKGAVMYYQLQIRNHSNVGYDIDQVRFFIKDIKRDQRTGSQETELTPLYVQPNAVSVEAHQVQSFVYALPKITLGNKKLLYVLVSEKDGGRSLHFHLTNRILMKAKVLEGTSLHKN